MIDFESLEALKVLLVNRISSLVTVSQPSDVAEAEAAEDADGGLTTWNE